MEASPRSVEPVAQRDGRVARATHSISEFGLDPTEDENENEDDESGCRLKALTGFGRQG